MSHLPIDDDLDDAISGIVLEYHDAPDDEPILPTASTSYPRDEHAFQRICLHADMTPAEAVSLLHGFYTSEWIAMFLNERLKDEREEDRILVNSGILPKLIDAATNTLRRSDDMTWQEELTAIGKESQPAPNQWLPASIHIDTNTLPELAASMLLNLFREKPEWCSDFLAAFAAEFLNRRREAA
jgi:hypothetical protein